jgi:hypothetical protein
MRTLSSSRTGLRGEVTSTSFGNAIQEDGAGGKCRFHGDLVLLVLVNRSVIGHNVLIMNRLHHVTLKVHTGLLIGTART